MERCKSFPQQQLGNIALRMFWIPAVIAILFVVFLMARTPQAAVSALNAATASELGLPAPAPETPSVAQVRPDATTSGDVVHESPVPRAEGDSFTQIEALDPVGAGRDTSH